MLANDKVPLWKGRPPYASGDYREDAPFLDIYRADPKKSTGSAMLIFPGGSYTFLSEKSGSEYGKWLAAEGVTGCVVNFRLGSRGHRYRALLSDGWRAISLVRSMASAWNIDPQKVGVIGTSAGGHLASLLLTGAGRDTLHDCSSDELDPNTTAPALGVLCYSVLSMTDPLAHQETRGNFLGEQKGDKTMQEAFTPYLHVSSTTAPCFIWHTIEDKEVSVDNSKRFAEALSTQGVPHEVHFYEKGAHALGLARNEGLLWSNDCIRWLRSHEF
ncbi:MAG TPA: alpha/beta hydrolase [Candidatus Angelobacter sp.]|nr:alpha/beta hydrolase [Candidatus Angelobacter sp.]